ncbi:MAG: phosphate/phosphite/phosphonate ABC transporter substrate-binding protein [Myxococcales bacterium]|nr:phosphate/phosphite/phosphonate ABC transporter substrate-binding protein [Myxococcales bacterium]
MNVSRDEYAALQFALPPSLGTELGTRSKLLQDYLKKALGRDAAVVTPGSYEQLARELLAGKVDAAWAPPFVCARIEAMGVRVLVRGVRNGASTYRAALVCRKDANVTLETLQGTTAAWSDRDSVGGYLLPMAFLREKGLEPLRTFFRQDFLGSYRATLEAVAAGKADVTSLFAPSAKGGQAQGTGSDEVWPGHEGDFKVIAYTEDAPNDGVAVSMGLNGAVVTELEKALLNLHQSPEGQAVLKDCFHAEKFEVSPRMGYRALYRVALASL